MKRILFPILGTFFLVLGLIGLLLPVIPQVPFLIAALLFYAGCIPGLHRWLVSTKAYQKYLQPHAEKHKFLRDILGE